jgi:hypothetical protein
MINGRSFATTMSLPGVQITHTIRKLCSLMDDVDVIVAHLMSDFDALQSTCGQGGDISLISEVSRVDDWFVERVGGAQCDGATGKRVKENGEEHEALSIIGQELIRDEASGINTSIVNPKFLWE